MCQEVPVLSPEVGDPSCTHCDTHSHMGTHTEYTQSENTYSQTYTHTFIHANVLIPHIYFLTLSYPQPASDSYKHTCVYYILT